MNEEEKKQLKNFNTWCNGTNIHPAIISFINDNPLNLKRIEAIFIQGLNKLLESNEDKPNELKEDIQAAFESSEFLDVAIEFADYYAKGLKDVENIIDENPQNSGKYANSNKNKPISQQQIDDMLIDINTCDDVNDFINKM